MSGALDTGYCSRRRCDGYLDPAWLGLSGLMSGAPAPERAPEYPVRRAVPRVARAHRAHRASHGARVLG